MPWAEIQPLNELAGSLGGIVRLDRKTRQDSGLRANDRECNSHSVEDAGDSQPTTDAGNRTVWFKTRAVRRVQ
jgi:hypothetical protein